MEEKRKISVRKILQVFLTLVVSASCIIAMVSASGIADTKTLTSIAVHIRNDKKYHFIEQQEIMNLAINNRNIDIVHTPLSKLDLHGMEQVILADPWVSDAQVYVDNARVLQMYVTQRIPVARIFQSDNRSYYMDTTLSIMPLSKNYIYYTTVVTNVPELKNDSAGLALKKQILALVRHIRADTFWNAQISQVIVDSDATFELMPVIGNQRILFGDASAMNEKFNDLFLFYKNVLNRIGWDKYQTLDVRFKGQVVALPSLPYKGPVDKAVTNMNWITSIVETEAANDAKDSLRVADTKVVNMAAEKKKNRSEKVAIPVMQARPSGKLLSKAGTKKKKTDKKKKTAKKSTQKTKPGDKNKSKKKIKERNKQKTPKYIYPDKKNH